MALNIKDEETDRLVRELANLAGESLTEAIRESVRERLERYVRMRTGEGRAEKLLRIGKLCAAHLPEDMKSSDHAELLYDEQGLPGDR